MASGVYPVRASEDEKDRWQKAADAAGLSFNAWARRTLNGQVDLEKALIRLETQPPVFRPDPKPVSTKKVKRR